MQGVQQARAYCSRPVPAACFRLQIPELAVGQSGRGELRFAPSFTSPTSHWEVRCLSLTPVAVPGKSTLCPLKEVVKELGVYHTSFRLKELIAITP